MKIALIEGVDILEDDALLAVARQLAYQNQLHRILTGINEAIVRIHDPQALYAEACRIATSADLFRMAWVGLVDAEAGLLRPVAWAGAEDGYLARIRISVGDDPEGRGPSGSAIREGHYFICEDFESDPRMWPWREEALRRGYRSSAAFPLVLDGQVFGAFTLYAGVARCFDRDAVDLLTTLAADLSFAVHSAEVERQRREAEARLRQAHDELEMRVLERTAALEAAQRRASEILASITDCYYALDHDWQFTAINEHALVYFGLPRAAFIGRSIWDVFPATRDSFIRDNFELAISERSPAHFDFHSLVVDRWAEMHAYPTAEGVSVYFRDITARKDMEEALKATRDQLDLRVRERTAELATANARLERRAGQLRVLHKIDRAILSARSPKTIARVAVDYIRQIVPCRWASVLLLDADTDRLQRLATNDDAPMRLLPGTHAAKRSWRLASELLAGRSAEVEDLQALADPSPAEESMLAEGVRSCFSMPLVVANQTIGALNLLRDQPGRLAHEHQEVVRQVADSLAVAIHNARLLEQVQCSRDQLQHLSHRLVETQENERRAIARELHDEAGQSLTGLKLGLSLVARDRQCPPPLTAQLDELRQTVDDVMVGLHRLAVNLRPVSLDRLGLVAALGQYAETFERQTGVQVDLAAPGLEDPALPDSHSRRLPAAVETTLFRVVQEAMTNVARHARATRVGIILQRYADRALAIVEDNGAGFDVDAAMARGRLGLVGMCERAEMLGGKVTIESFPGGGTTIFAEVPVMGPAATK